jgi:single-strand DNA-binding protein
MNQVALVGRLGRKPELRYTQQGTAVCTFSIAVDNGQGKDADWFDIVAWQKLAETCAQHLDKGRQVAVSGRLQTRSWETQDGQKRKAVEVVAGRVDFIGPKSEATGSGEEGLGMGQANGVSDDEGDVPF